MTLRERLLDISELDITNKLAPMNENQLHEYIEALGTFVDVFPSFQAEIKEAFEKKDFLSLSIRFVATRDLLSQIHARDMAEECQKLINGLVTSKHEKIEAHLTYLLSVLTMLSIDIQMAIFQDEGGGEEAPAEDAGQGASQQDGERRDQPGRETEQASGARHDEAPEPNQRDDAGRQDDPAQTETPREQMWYDTVNFDDEDPSEEYHQAEIGYEQEIGKMNILAVDDDAFLLESLKKAFSDTGYKLTGVNSGMTALRFLQRHNPDLFILDIDMPEMNGYELAHKIREHGCKSPIIFLTGNATRDYVLKAIRAGASDFVIKPVTRGQVIERVSKFI